MPSHRHRRALARPDCGIRLQCEPERLAAPSCADCRQRTQLGWAALSPDESQQLESDKICNTYLPGQVLFYEGNQCLGLHCIESGAVVVRYSSPVGTPRGIRIAHGGQVLGYRSLFEGTSYPMTAVVAVKSRVCFIDRAAVLHLINRHPVIGFRFARLIIDEIRMSQRLLAAPEKPLESLLQEWISSLVPHWSSYDEAKGWQFAPPLSYKEIADLFGLEEQVFTHMLTKVEAECLGRLSHMTAAIDRV